MLYYFIFCNTIHNISRRCYKMAFHIKPNRKETENKTIRFPITLIDRIERAIVGKNVTFSKFVIQACEYALNDMEEDKKDSK